MVFNANIFEIHFLWIFYETYIIISPFTDKSLILFYSANSQKHSCCDKWSLKNSRSLTISTNHVTVYYMCTYTCYFYVYIFTSWSKGLMIILPLRYFFLSIYVFTFFIYRLLWIFAVIFLIMFHLRYNM